MRTIIQDYTVGSVSKELLRYAIPFMLSNGLQVFYSLVDMLVVGRYVGSHALSAVSVSSQILVATTMFCVGFAQSGQVLIAHLIGEKRRTTLGNAIGALCKVMLFLAVITTAGILLFRGQLLRLVQTPPEAYEMALDYLTVCGAGIGVTFAYNTVSAILRGLGDSVHPLVFILIATVVNTVLDFFLVAGLHWGVYGAAVATVLGQLVSVLAAVSFLCRHRSEIGLSAQNFSVKAVEIREILHMGIPFALQSGVINISMAFVGALVNAVGVNASAVYGIGIKLDDIAIKITQGILYSVSFFVGQNMAAGELQRVKQAVYWGWIYSLAGYLAVLVLYLTESEWLFSLFTKDLPTISMAPVFTHAIIWCFPALILMRGVLGLIQGIGNARLSFGLGLMDGVFRVVCSFFFGIKLGMGLFGYVLGYGLAAYAIALPGFAYFLSGKWKHYHLLKAWETTGKT